ncbi:unnamed protein product [Lathyrus oleraceus]
MDKRFVFLLLLFPFPFAKLCKQYHSFQASMDVLSVKQARILLYSHSRF